MSQSNALLAIARNAGDAGADSPKIFNVITSDDTEQLTEDFGFTTDAVNFHLADFDCPPELRAFVDALIGIAGGRAAFYASDATIAKRAGRSTKWVQRNRDEFTNWQQMENVTFIQINDNYTGRDGNRIPHEYVMHLSKIAVETAQGARSDPAWQKSPGAAIARTVRRRRGEIPTDAPRTRRGRKKEPDAETIIIKNLRTARTLIEKAGKLAGAVRLQKEMFGSGEDFQISPELIEGLQQSINVLQGEDGDVSSIKEERRVDTAEGSTARAQGGDGGQNVHMDIGHLNHVARVDARKAVKAFESVGTVQFSVTMLDEETKKEALFETVSNLKGNLHKYSERNEQWQESFIVRPEGAPLIQLDDLSAEARSQVEPFSFLSVETSPGNFQAWVALPEGDERDVLRKRLIDGTGADRGASGALRWPGSINRKEGREGFRVRTVHTTPARLTTRAELEAAGLLAPVPPQPAPQATRPKATRAPRSWPDYEQCLKDAPLSTSGARKGLPSRSDADNDFCWKALDRGWSASEVTAKLREVSDKAKKRKPEYAQKTVAKLCARHGFDYV